MRILYVTTIGATMEFFAPLIRQLLDAGHQVDMAANISERDVPDCYRRWGCQVHPIACARSPLASGNRKAICQIRKLVKSGKYDIVHCHTPIAALCTRLACRDAAKWGTRVFYTAHGFHFYRGAPMKNWLVYYPAEWFCAHVTDVLITINREDYALARRRMKAKQVVLVPGVGVDLARFCPDLAAGAQVRSALGIPARAKLLLSVGELNENKNHSLVIRALAALADPNIHYVVAGIGDQTQTLQNLARKLQVADRVHLLGYRVDVPAFYNAADVFVQPSYREGLPVSLVEAMASGLPCAVSRIRGNTDLIDETGGALFAPDSVADCCRALQTLLSCDTTAMAHRNRETVKELDISLINRRMKELYETV